MKEIKDKLKEWGSICRISNIMEDPLTYSHSDMLSFAKYYHESKLKNNEVLDLVSKCAYCGSENVTVESDGVWCCDCTEWESKKV